MAALESMFPSLAAAALICLGLFLSKDTSNRSLLIFLSCFSGFYINGVITADSNSTSLTGQEKSFFVSLNNGVKVDGDSFSALGTIVGSQEKLAITYRIKTNEKKILLKEEITPGAVCKVNGRLTLPPAARNPNAFDYKNYLFTKGAFWIFESSSLECGPGNSNLINRIKKIRLKGISYLENHYPAEAAAISIALVFGDRSMIDPDTILSYQKAGVIHLLAISGLHVGLLSGMLYFFLLRIGLTRERTLELLLVLLPIYAVLTGLSPPVNRAASMIMIILAAKRFHLTLSPLSAISFSLLAYLLINPYIIYDVGFQLSFRVSFTLIISAKPVMRKQSYFIRMVLVSLLAQLASLPILMYHFYEISLISILANCIFVPLYSFIILPVCLLLFIVHLLLPMELVFFVEVFSLITQAANGLSVKLASLPGAAFITGRPSFQLLLFLVIVHPIMLMYFENPKIQTVNRTVIILAVFLFVLVVPATYSPYGKVVFIDVGQGDSILIKLPYNQGIFLIDTGGNMVFEQEAWKRKSDKFEVGKDILVPYLKSEGVRSIDKLILTHGDLDHIGGAQALFTEIKIKELILPASKSVSITEERLLKLAESYGVMTHRISEGPSWKAGKAKFKVLGPPGEKDLGGNNQSIILLADIGGLTWLFTGDAELEAESQLIKNFPEYNIDILKAGHHGSKTSTTEQLLDHFKPEGAILSAGQKNRYGHPHQEVLGRLERRGIKIFRTDKNGAITYSFRGEKGTFSKEIP
ncbi:DNA internalization-related competence protein ComEC/Rec2 [Mesobacillus harenae]|uniref:DNA internalization-related competence protein ComEC/Rec2 n=1 Tax=Mesobacillus harenae TaxID=2213203 RepID=UPI00158055B4|nr:DNA internalization-related competence protein ComEC/Rec2 [Mesobacillus harenae]